MLRANRNALRRYPAPGRDGDRLYPLASPSVTPGFRIAPTDTVFAIGSCFAAEHGEGARNRRPPRPLPRLRPRRDRRPARGRDELLQQVLDPLRHRTKSAGRSTAQASPERRSSTPRAPTATSTSSWAWAASTSRSTRSSPSATATSTRWPPWPHADVVILTLGYVETWFDRALGLYLNVAPPAPLIRDQPGRFEFVVLSYNDVLAGLEAFHDLLLRHRTRPLRMLVTVSPVPLLSTFRGVDVLVANAYSKSVQRAALEEFVKGRRASTTSRPTNSWRSRTPRSHGRGTITGT